LRGERAGHALCLLATVGIDDGDVCPRLRQLMANALPQPAVAARYQSNRAFELHVVPPIAAAGASTPPAFTVCRPTHGAANPRRQGGKVERAPSPGPVGCLASGERRGHCSARVWTCGAAWKS